MVLNCQNVKAVISMAARKLAAKAARRFVRCVRSVKAYTPKKPPAFCNKDVMPIQVVVLPARSVPEKPSARNDRSKTGRKRSKLKKPIPHSPTTPAKARSIPTIELRRQDRKSVV